MGSVNVNRNVTDSFYRYKMPRLIAKVEGKGNGIKTVIVNMVDIAKALDRPPVYPTKYFGCELGAQTQIDSKNERYIVNGDHDAMKLQELLDGFIQRYVLCAECENPETDISVKKGQIVQKCKACGHGRTVDLTHRLSTYIVKNPPGADNDKKGEKVKGKKKKDQDKAAEGQGGDAADGGVQAPPERTSKEGSEEDEDDDWCVDPDDAEQRKQEMSQAMAALTVNEDMERPEDERLDMFLRFLENAKAAGDLDGKAVVTEAERLDIKEKAVLVLCRLVLDKDVVQQVKQFRNLFLRFTVENGRAQRYLLGGLEQLIIAHKAELLGRAPLVLKAFYDADIVEEEALLEWGKKASKRFVSKEENKEIRDKAAPFLTWLAEAEEETSSEEEDGVEIEFGSGEGGGGQANGTAAKPMVNGTGAIKEEAEDDLDIDDI